MLWLTHPTSIHGTLPFFSSVYYRTCKDMWNEISSCCEPTVYSITNGVVCLTHSIPIKRWFHGQSAFLIVRRVMGMSFGLENWDLFYNFLCYANSQCPAAVSQLCPTLTNGVVCLTHSIPKNFGKKRWFHGQSAFLIVRRVMGMSFGLENWDLFYNFLCYPNSQYPAAVSQLCPSITNGVVCLTHSIPIKRCLHGQSAFLIDRRVMGMSFGLENWAWLISCLFVCLFVCLILQLFMLWEQPISSCCEPTVPIYYQWGCLFDLVWLIPYP